MDSNLDLTPGQSHQHKQFVAGLKVYILREKLLPKERFMPKPEVIAVKTPGQKGKGEAEGEGEGEDVEEEGLEGEEAAEVDSEEEEVLTMIPKVVMEREVLINPRTLLMEVVLLSDQGRMAIITHSE